MRLTGWLAWFEFLVPVPRSRSLASGSVQRDDIFLRGKELYSRKILAYIEGEIRTARDIAILVGQEIGHAGVKIP
jgi:hypothetical protein